MIGFYRRTILRKKLKELLWSKEFGLIDEYEWYITDKSIDILLEWIKNNFKLIKKHIKEIK